MKLNLVKYMWDMGKMMDFLRKCYSDSSMFTTEWDEFSVRKSLTSYLSNDMYIIKTVTNEFEGIMGMYILVIIPEFINFNSRVCVEFLWRPDPWLKVRDKVKVMNLMLKDMEETALEITGKYPQFHLETNNDIYKHLMKKGYKESEKVLEKIITGGVK